LTEEVAAAAVEADVGRMERNIHAKWRKRRIREEPTDGFHAFKTLLFRTFRFRITKYIWGRILIFKDAANSQNIADMKRLFSVRVTSDALIRLLGLISWMHVFLVEVENLGKHHAGSLTSPTRSVRFLDASVALTCIQKTKTHQTILPWILMIYRIHRCGSTKGT
jgi:hypothetical protein